MAINISFKVCPPGLHITLGIYQRLFNLLEEECHQLDLSANDLCVAPCIPSTNTFEVYLRAKSAVQSLKEEQLSLTTEVDQAQQMLVLLLVAIPNPEQDLRVQEVARLIQNNTTKIKEIVRLPDQ